MLQPPSGGCVLKLSLGVTKQENGTQPPSGGCVLKRRIHQVMKLKYDAAAFGRLCVETQALKS